MHVSCNTRRHQREDELASHSGDVDHPVHDRRRRAAIHPQTRPFHDAGLRIDREQLGVHDLVENAAGHDRRRRTAVTGVVLPCELKCVQVRRRDLCLAGRDAGVAEVVAEARPIAAGRNQYQQAGQRDQANQPP